MKILHAYCLNYNIGDYALGIGLKNLLRHFLNVELIGNTNIQGRQFNEYYIKEVVNKLYEMLVIGGGGIIHGAHWPNGWFWLIDMDTIKEIKIPFIVYGAGYNYWENEKIPQRGIDHLIETQKHAAYFSVRNDGSAKRLLDQTGIKAKIVPDPGFHVNVNTEYKRSIYEPYVIIQIANDKPEHRFGSLANRKTFITQMKETTQHLAKKYKVVFAPHVYDDVSISKDIADGIDNAIVWNFGYFAFNHSDEVVGYYKYAEFVISMRGHGQIVPICFNTPVISLINHPKHRGLMEELSLLEYTVEIKSENFIANLYTVIDKIETNKNQLINRYKQINQLLWKDSEQAFIDIKKALKI